MDDESINACHEGPGEERKGQPHVYIPIHKYKIKGIFDTGATRTAMSYSLFYSLLTNGVDLPMETVDQLQIRGITGDKLEIVGPSSFSVHIRKHPILPSCSGCHEHAGYPDHRKRLNGS